jgi:hypothetical protein
MQDCVFGGKIGESAAAPFKTTAGVFNVGGVIGVMGEDTSYGPEIEDCHARASGFFVEYGGTSTLSVGGFNGYTNGGAVSACSAEGAINLHKTGSTGTIYFGGFTGYVNNYSPRTSEFVRCYATANLTSESTAPQYVAGFLAYADGSTTTIANCYATGDVKVTDGSIVYAGGLVGDTNGDDGALSAVNCYATGDITAIGSTGGTVNAGGIIAFINLNVTINRCFAGGTVSGSGHGDVNAGGIAGINHGDIKNSAVYGGSVSASANTNHHAYRIWGHSFQNNKSGNNNHAFKTMRTGTATNGGTIIWTVPGDSSPTATSNQGANATGDDFRSSWFWQNILEFKSSETITGTVNGVAGQTIVSGHAWGFSTVFGKGHPVLLNADGSVMGGQMAAP